MAKGDADPEKWVLEEHTRAKHDILAYYLDAWFPILSSGYGRVLFIDGFAGRGRYTGGEPGSPVIALDHLLKHSAWRRMRNREFVFLFVEKDADNAASLEQVIEEYKADYVAEAEDGKWPKNVKPSVAHGSFEDVAGEICDYLQEQKSSLAPTFAFIDPFGWTDFPMELIARLLNHRSCEVFVNFMVGNVNRFLEHPHQVSNMNALFGLDVEGILADYDGSNRVEYLRNVYAQQLQDVAGFPYVRWFAMKNHTGNIVYYLLHGTREEVGVERMKDAMWKTAPDGNYTFSDRLAGLDVLFSPDPDLTPLRQGLLAEFTGQHGLRVNPDLQRWVVLHTPYRKPHLTTVLRALEKEKPTPIAVHRPNGPRQQFAAGVTLDVLV